MISRMSGSFISSVSCTLFTPGCSWFFDPEVSDRFAVALAVVVVKVINDLSLCRAVKIVSVAPVLRFLLIRSRYDHVRQASIHFSDDLIFRVQTKLTVLASNPRFFRIDQTYAFIVKAVING